MKLIQRFLRTRASTQEHALGLLVGVETWKTIPIPDIESITQGRILGFPLVYITTRSGGHIVFLGEAAGIRANLLASLEALVRRCLEQTKVLAPDAFPSAITIDRSWAQISVELADSITVLRSTTALEYVHETPDHSALLELWTALESPGEVRAKYIRNHIDSELATYKELFDKIEDHPLTQEQREACVVADDRQLLVAAAGSGKSSVIVAKVKYLLEKGWIKPQEAVLLAFNNEAAKELRKRCNEKLAQYPGHEDLVIKTFHSFGLDLIAANSPSRKKPTPSLYTKDEGRAQRQALIRHLVEDAIMANPANAVAFNTLQATMKGRRPPVDVLDKNAPGRFVTLKGDVVKSTEELRIANFLFQRGIPYEYERAYQFDVSDPEHGQYKPDFYFPAIDVYYEHFAINSQGQAPENFPGYLEKTQWRRNIHAEKGTRLFETLSADFENRSVYEKILYWLHKFGFDFKGQTLAEVALGEIDIVEPAVAALDKFINNRKLSGVTDKELYQRAHEGGSWLLDVLPLAIEVARGYQATLDHDGEIDFTDMILMATASVQAAPKELPYRYLLIDEFQDISRIRADMVRAILARSPGCKLFCVGDDWQSINGFSGSELRYMQDFHDEFGAGTTQYLTRTFRSNQGIANVASALIMKNPAQIPKKVQALDPNCDQVIEVHFMENQEDLAHVLGGVYEDAVGLPPSKKPGKPNEIYSLARNRHFVKKPGVTPNEFEGLHAKWTGDLEAKGAGSYVVKFDTFHGSKGSEAHIAILNGLVTKEVNKRCFPSRMPENELICLPLPRREGFEDAEERRLFYVALTRAKQKVVIPTMLDGMSSFVEELFEHVGTVKFLYKQSRAKICPVCSRGIMVYTDRNHIRCNNTKCELGNTESEHVCPECRKGRILPLLGPYGIWFSCNNYPACKHTDRDRTNKLGKMARLTPA